MACVDLYEIHLVDTDVMWPLYLFAPPFVQIGMGAGREEGNRELEGSLKLGELGNCIRQLALSVQDTGMFGDLPRPRMHEK